MQKREARTAPLFCWDVGLLHKSLCPTYAVTLKEVKNYN